MKTLEIIEFAILGVSAQIEIIESLMNVGEAKNIMLEELYRKLKELDLIKQGLKISGWNSPDESLKIKTKRQKWCRLEKPESEDMKQCQK